MKTQRSARQATEKRLERLARDLDAVAGYFEERGFETQSELLDAAADSVEDVQDSLAAL